MGTRQSDSIYHLFYSAHISFRFHLISHSAIYDSKHLPALSLL